MDAFLMILLPVINLSLTILRVAARASDREELQEGVNLTLQRSNHERNLI
jgi:hypothetical protein